MMQAPTRAFPRPEREVPAARTVDAARSPLASIEAREAERRRIARELHDELGQGLAALKIDLVDYVGQEHLDTHDTRLRGVFDRLDEVMGAVRRIASDLRPVMLDELGPVPAIEWLVRDFAQRTGLHCRLELDEQVSMGDGTAIALYRMVQEALSNVARHAQASEVQVALHQAGDRLELSVGDDGVGFAPDSAPASHQFGLLGMHERAQLLGGDLRIHSSPGGGTRLTMSVPAATGTQERSRRRRD